MSRYADPNLECDLVMKGGITSGVIYPLAICRLAERYRLRSIGGASAGAIAAAAAAAAECGRQRHLERVREAASQGLSEPILPAGSSFEGLEALPAKMGAPRSSVGLSQLQSLFQPTEAGKPVFDLALAMLGRTSRISKGLGILRAVGDVAPATFVLALLLTALLVWIGTRADHLLAWFGVAIAVVTLLALLGAVAAFVFALRANRALGPENGYGLCPGFNVDERSDTPGLTRWLADLFDELAGQTPGGAPLSMGDLEAQGIDFLAMTASVTHGRPYRLPFEKGADWFFRRGDFERLFPKRVVDFMVERALKQLDVPKRKKLRRLFDQANEGAETPDYFPFPGDADLPLVVAARMSLSFPVLVQAVPLYAVDWTLSSNRKSDGVRFERCWFSDGGLCSNLPLHFFDALLPTRPTFALDLREAHEDHPVRVPPFGLGQSERNNVWLPTSNGAGAAERWNRFEGGAVPAARFLWALLDTAQSWNDQLTSKYPGYRDRVVHIFHTEEEGGLNLDMPAVVIERLAARGAAAGEVLRDKFDPATGRRGWDNHFWVRYRVLLATLTQEATAFAQLDDGANEALKGLLAEPPSYRLTSSQRKAVNQINKHLVELAAALGSGPSLAHRAPKPRAQLKTRPMSG
ncbi:patatin-like phospholipase family protein [Vulgatibacter incomptus]|uniref:RpoH suppressor n=1 Tax=Vulgatibacter incomptus TaxID=1391653 RepID=A0A0K1PCM9_9BACT|nr:patatin-like phospholipase family protein [Vulgatibacter incomptus]AKU91176.1 RpoH suppressor [Vulgatibacter incomptus]